jgi:subtilase family serine protease
LAGQYGAVRTAGILAFEVAVDNLGTGDAGASVMTVTLGDHSGRSLISASVLVPLVPAGGSAKVNVSLDTSAMDAGQYKMNIALDQQNNLSELDETNNGLAWNLTVLGTAQAPALLMVATVSVDGVLEDGNTVTITAPVANAGDSNLTGVLVEFFIDGKAVSTRTLDVVSGRTARLCSIHWTASGGRHTVSVAVSVNGEYGVPGQLPISVRYGAADDAGQAWAFALGAALMLMALAAIIIIVGRPKRPQAGHPPGTEEE